MSGGGNPSVEARENTIRKAKREGRLVIFGEPGTLQLDLDSKAAEEKALELLGRFAERLGVIVVHRSTSPGGNAHFYVRLAGRMDRTERTFWQAALGSDRTREALGWLWLQAGHEEECFLIETEFYELTEVEI